MSAAASPSSTTAGSARADVTVIEEDNATTIVRVAGELDIATVDALDSTLRTLAQRRCGRIVVDLSEVGFMDSAGLRALVRAKTRMDRGGRWLVTRGASGQPKRLLEIGRVHYGLTF